MDTQRIEAAVRELLLAIGEDPEREGLQETPRRVTSPCTRRCFPAWRIPTPM